jgi:hypothetical protein
VSRRLRTTDFRADQITKCASVVSQGDMRYSHRQQAAYLFRPIRPDGWVSLETSPPFACDSQRTPRQRVLFMPSRLGPICSSRFPAPRRALERSRKPSSEACPLTARCSSRAITIWPRPRRTCAAWNVGSPTPLSSTYERRASGKQLDVPRRYASGNVPAPRAAPCESRSWLRRIRPENL